MRLAVRLTLAIAGGAVVPLFVATWLSTRIATAGAREASDTALLRDARDVASYVLTWTGDQTQAVAGWTMPFRASGLGPEARQNLLSSVLRAVPSTRAVMLVDKRGVALGSPVWVDVGADRGSLGRSLALVPRLPLAQAMAERDRLVTDGRNLPGSAVGPAYLPTGASAASIPVAAAGPNLGEEAVLGAEISLETIEKHLAERTSATHAVALLSAGGSPIVGGGHALVDPGRIGQLPQGGDSTFEHALADGTAVRGAKAEVPGLRWTVVVVEPASLVDAPRAAILRQAAAILAVAAALGTGLAFLLARSFARPVGELRDGALALADGDLERRVGARAADELGELARAFNHMAEQLSADRIRLRRQQDEIEAFNQELQARVDERTRELVTAQQRLVESAELAAVAELSAGMAHELNNPLTAVLGLAQVLRARLGGRAEDGLAVRIEEQATRARDVVAAMLRVSADRGADRGVGVIDLRDVVSDVVAVSGGAFRLRGIEVNSTITDVPLPVWVDPARASRVLAQLLRALRAGLPAGAHVQLVAEGLPPVVRIEADRSIAAGDQERDEFRAAGFAWWVARRELDGIGGGLDVLSAPEAPVRWRVRFAEAPGVA